MVVILRESVTGLRPAQSLGEVVFNPRGIDGLNLHGFTTRCFNGMPVVTGIFTGGMWHTSVDLEMTNRPFQIASACRLQDIQRWLAFCGEFAPTLNSILHLIVIQLIIRRCWLTNLADTKRASLATSDKSKKHKPDIIALNGFVQ